MFLSESDVRARLRYEDLIPALRRALIDFSAGRVIQPVRTALEIPEHQGIFALMPAVYGDLMATKLVTFYPNNSGIRPTHQAIIQLLSAVTGEPLATMDGRLITEMRTAAVSAIAADLLAPAEARVLAILGSGVQARSHLETLHLVRPFTEVRVWSRTPQHAAQFASQTGARDTTAEAAVEGADVVVTVTSSPTPVLKGAWLKPKSVILAVGAVGPALRELDDEALQATIIVESRESAIRESGDILLSGAPIYVELGELLSGTTPLPLTGRTVFKSLGIAIEDLVAAKLVYESTRRTPPPADH
jgi:ornithine cyclodeaminase/alanine dehydrogenase-like protein (mu-crystallin family)